VPAAKSIVLDANILIRAVLGKRVRAILLKYCATVRFIAPQDMIAEAEEHLPRILSKRGAPAAEGLAVLDAVRRVVQTIDREAYSVVEKVAKQRLARRDPDDWPVLATAIVFDCPIWTEDSDLFGAGVATWTTDRVEIYLENSSD
jgi:predicted nucleic acid-binding protein